MRTTGRRLAQWGIVRSATKYSSTRDASHVRWSSESVATASARASEGAPFRDVDRVLRVVFVIEISRVCELLERALRVPTAFWVVGRLPKLREVRRRRGQPIGDGIRVVRARREVVVPRRVLSYRTLERGDDLVLLRSHVRMVPGRAVKGFTRTHSSRARHSSETVRIEIACLAFARPEREAVDPRRTRALRRHLDGVPARADSTAFSRRRATLGSRAHLAPEARA